MKRRDVRWPAVLLLAATAPTVLVSAVLTLSVLGAVFGIPGLVLSVPVGLAAVRVIRRPNESALRAPLAIRGSLLAGLLTGGFLTVAVVGWNDVDSTQDWLFVAAGVVWLGVAWAGAIGAVRSSRT